MAKIDPNDKSWDDKVAGSGGGKGVLPDGDHLVFIAEAKLSTSKVNGTPSCEITFDCHDPLSPHCGKSLRYQNFWLTDAAMPRFIRMLRAFGCSATVDTESQQSINEHVLELMGKITVKSKKETFNGEEKLKTEAAFFSKLTGVERQRLVDEYGDTMLPPIDDEMNPGGGAPGNPLNDEDIPF
jgi:hypothetical protein